VANGCSSTPSRARGLRELRGAREAVLFAYVSAFASTVPLLMRLPLPRLAALLTRRPARRRQPAAAVQRLDALVALAQGVAPCVRGGCLTRGVTLFWFLRRAGVDVQLCFGLDPAAGDAAAAADGHCWLVHDGEPFLERADPRTRFAETFRLPVERT
jgi:hypothetical protein